MTPPVVWVRCEDTSRLAAIGDLAARLRADGDEVLFLVTVRGGPDGHTPHPKGSRGVRAFVAEHRPLLTIIVDGVVDTNVLAACDDARVPVVTINARPDTLREMTGGWFRAGGRPALADIVASFAEDPKLLETLLKLGLPPDRAHRVGPWERAPTILPVREDSRQATAELLGRRPMWFARGVRLQDAPMVAQAHRLASRHSMRLLLCVSPAIPMEGEDIVAVMTEAGLGCGLRSRGDQPTEATQVYVTDLDGEDGLWLRLAPITFAAGTTSTGAAHDPFEAAALGSVVLHGSQTAPFADRFNRLIRDKASLPFERPDDLGPAVVSMLPADRAADMALAGWTVMSSGSEISDQIVTLVQDQLDARPG